VITLWKLLPSNETRVDILHYKTGCGRLQQLTETGEETHNTPKDFFPDETDERHTYQ
jgi:hypothetical protein